jgi:hypothetical protein
MLEIRRREFVALLGGAAAWPLAARAQQGDRVRRIGVLMGLDENDPMPKASHLCVHASACGLGLTLGRNLRMDLRGGGGDATRIRALAREVVGRRPDIILTGTTPATAAVQRETRIIPIVFAGVAGIGTLTHEHEQKLLSYSWRPTNRRTDSNQGSLSSVSDQVSPRQVDREESTAKQKMHEINEAYEVLSDNKAREQYDRARQKKEFDEYESENDATQDAFRSAEQAQRSDWDVAVEYYPDLDTIYADLKRTSFQLAFAFRETMLETKQFPAAKKVADDLEASFLKVYFGSNSKLLAFARNLIADGHKDAAKELNRAIYVLGTSADADLVISQNSKEVWSI